MATALSTTTRRPAWARVFTPGARPDQVALDSPSHYVGTGILCPVRSVVDALRSYPDRHAGTPR